MATTVILKKEIGVKGAIDNLALDSMRAASDMSLTLPQAMGLLVKDTITKELRQRVGTDLIDIPIITITVEVTD